MRNRLLLLILMIVVAIAGTANWAVERRPSHPLQPVALIETTHSLLYAPQYVALHHNFFSQQGLSVSVQVAATAAKAAEAVLTGQADFALCGLEQAVYAAGQGSRLLAFGLLAQRGDSVLVSRLAEPDFQWGDLAGKTVISSDPGGGAELTLRAILAGDAGLASTVRIVGVQTGNAVHRFQAGVGDYLLLSEPEATRLVQAGAGRVAANLSEASHPLPVAAYQVTSQMIVDHPDWLQPFANAICQALHWVTTHSAEEVAQAIAPAFPDLSLGMLTAAVARYQQLGVWTDDPRPDPSEVARLVAIAALVTGHDQSPDYATIVNTSFVEKALRSSR